MAGTIELILTEDSEAGKAGDLKKVRPGYARNFLLPRGLAVVADLFNMQAYQARLDKIKQEAENNRNKAAENFDKLGQDASVSLKAKAGEAGKLFGSVSKDDIAQAINKNFGLSINRLNIKLNKAIKALGDYNVRVDFGFNFIAEVVVKINAEK